MNSIRTLTIALALALLAGCEAVTAPEGPKPTAVDTAAALDTLRARQAVQIHTWKLCVQGEDKTTALEWEDPRFWGSIKLQIGADTLRTRELHSNECQDLGAIADTVVLKVISTATATRFEATWLQADSLPFRFYLPWRPVKLHADSLGAVSDSVCAYGARSLTKAHQTTP